MTGDQRTSSLDKEPIVMVSATGPVDTEALADVAAAAKRALVRLGQQNRAERRQVRYGQIHREVRYHD